MKNLILVVALFCGLAGSVKADEFESLAAEIRQLSGANATSIALLDGYLEGNRNLMLGFMKYEMALEGKQTSDAKINGLLDKWQAAYVTAVPQVIAEVELRYFRQHFTLEELTKIRDILRDPVMRKFAGAGIPPKPYFAELLAEIGKLNTAIMGQLEAADPDWWKLDAADQADARLDDADVLDFTKEWMKIKDFLSEYPDDRWHLLDTDMAEFVVKGGVQCDMPAKQAQVQALLGEMIEATRADLSDLMMQTDSNMLILRNEKGMDIATSRQALLEAAYLAVRDEGIAMWYNEAFDWDDSPKCENIKGWADSLLSKAKLIEKRVLD